jgi:hypothetical protein
VCVLVLVLRDFVLVVPVVVVVDGLPVVAVDMIVVVVVIVEGVPLVAVDVVVVVPVDGSL